MTDSKKIKDFSDEEILEYAKDEVSHDLASHGYPIWPTDEYGNPDTSDGPGCVPWCIVTECEVVDAQIDEREEEKVLVVVTLNLKWSDGDYEDRDDDDAEFVITVYVADSELCYEDIERCN